MLTTSRCHQTVPANINNSLITGNISTQQAQLPCEWHTNAKKVKVSCQKCQITRVVFTQGFKCWEDKFILWSHFRTTGQIIHYITVWLPFIYLLHLLWHTASPHLLNLISYHLAHYLCLSLHLNRLKTIHFITHTSTN